MTITINGTTGITNDGGYTGDGVVFADTTPANTLVTTTGGNVGIGTSSPSAFTGYTTVSVNNAANGGIYNILVNGTETARLQGYSGIFNVAAKGASTALTFETNGAERARIDTSGNLLVGTSSGGQDTRLKLQYGSGQTWGCGPLGSASNNFYVVNTVGTGVYLSSGNTSWTANSDERLKDIIEPITGATEKVATLRAVIGKYKTDAEGTRRSFLIAQDVQAVLPEAVTVNDDEINTLGVQYTEVIPLLTAAIQEQQAIILAQESALTALTARVAALDASLDARLTSLEGK